MLTRETLPTTAASLVALLGRRLAMAWMAHVHGTGGAGWVRIPRAIKPATKLVGIIGCAPAEKLCAAFGGRVIRVPCCNSIHRAKRNQEIKRLATAGNPQAQLARHFGLTSRQIRNVLTNK